MFYLNDTDICTKIHLSTTNIHIHTTENLYSIQTLTVGPGITPDQPKRLTDFHRRSGISPCP